MNYRVNLEVFRGPLDLLLYLVRKHEVEITDIPVSLIAEQYFQYLEVLEQLDVNDAGEFLVMASTLMEIKSRELLPRAEEVEEEIEDPRQDLVRQLLEYKKYKDAASMLEERSRSWQERFARQSSDLPPRRRDLADEPIREVELWDLVSAFGRIVRDQQVSQASNIVYDETPIHVYMTRIHERLKREGPLKFGQLFSGATHKSVLIGLFLAVLELVRHFAVEVEQDQPFGDLVIHLHPDADQRADFSLSDNYEHGKREESGEPGEEEE